MSEREIFEGTLDELARKNGFDGERDLFALVARVDLTRAVTYAAFECWKEHDGTKTGLLRIVKAQDETPILDAWKKARKL